MSGALRIAWEEWRLMRRNRVAVGIAAVLTLGLIATSVFALHAAWKECIQRDAAIAEAARVTAVGEVARRIGQWKA